ncbi:MAG: RpoL/Rpb11 RNA polymerase subunit family protein [archaeon]
MEVEIINKEKGDYELKVDDITVAEILRVYLNRQGVDFAAWRREHPDRPVVMKIQGKDVKKEVSDAVKAIKKDLDAIVKGVKK